MLHQSLLQRVFSLFLLLALVLSIVGQNTAVSAAPDTPLPFLDDFTGGAPSGFVGFADAWDGSGSSTTLVLTFPTDDLPTIPAKDATEVASVVYDVAASGGWGGGPGYAGVSRDFAETIDLSGYQALRFWFYGNSTGTEMRIELKSDGANPGVSNRFEYGFTDNFSGWRHFVLPFTSFVKRTDYNPGAGLGDDLDLTQMWGYSVLLPGGAAGTFLLDEVSVTGYAPLMADFTGGPPAGFVPFADSWDGSGSSTTLAVTYPTDDLPTIPAQDDTEVVLVTYNIAASGGWGGGPGYGGISHDYAEAQDWNNYQGFGFWYKGGSTGAAMRVELKTDGANPGASNRFEYGFADDFSDWKFFSIPWSSFVKRTDYNPGAGLGDDINFGTIWGYSILIPGGAAGSFSMDNIAAYGGGDSGGGPVVPVVRFNSANYIVNEDGGTATITVTLNTATTVEVTVDYATSDGTAADGVDYTAASGTLTFDAGDTSKTFTVAIADNGTYDGQKTINLALTDPVAATLGTPNTAVLTIVDDDAPDTRLVDDYTGSVAPLYNPFGVAIGFASWGSENGNVQIDNPTIADTDDLALPGQSGDISVLEVDYNIGSWGGFTHALEDGNDWVSQDWSRYDGVSFWLYGNNTGGVIQTEIFDNQQLGNPGDSAERWYYRITDDYEGWRFFRIPFSAFQRRTDYQPGGAPNDGLNLTEVSGYAFGFPAKTAVAYLADYSLYGDLSANPLSVRVQSAAYAYGADEGDPITVKVWLNEAAASQVTVDYSITPGTALAGINYTDASGTLTFEVGETVKTVVIDTIDDGKVAATLNMTFTLSNPGNAVLGWKEWATLGVFNTTTPDPGIIDDFEKGLPVPANLPTNPNGSVVFDWEQILAASPDAVPGQFPINYVLSGEYDAGASFNRLFSLPRDLSDYNALRFWYKGSNSGEPVKVVLLDGQPDPGPSGWTLAWEDEFVGADGDSPDTTYWNFNIGGQGWGNNEWQYYTDSRDNSALDGSGNLVITAMPNTDPSLECAYGPGAGSPPACSYTSARLLTKDKIDFAYGRVEARIKIPYGQGIWPAFWMLGSDIDEVSWPQSGEIDILENIGKASEQSLLYGTIHGPGYSGGSGVGSGPYDTGVTLHEDFHTYAIEWEPDEIRWYFDGVQYFSVTPDDIPDGTEWVFDKPFFIILNVAVGGNWPGYPDGTTTFPQHMTVDYVRVYQGPDNAQRFESSFVDDSSDWKLVTLPYSGFVSSATQPDGAASNASPILTHAHGYGFEFPSADGGFKLDDVRGVDVATSSIDVQINSVDQSTYVLEPGDGQRLDYAGLNNGPVLVNSTSHVLSSIRVLYKGASYSEMLGFPAEEITNEYWFPVYDSATLNSQLRIGNLGNESTTITVYLGDGEELDSFTLGANQAIRKNYTGENNGPLRVLSSATDILVSVRLLYGDSYSEELGFPADQLTNDYWFPWYNNVAVSSELRVANTGGAVANVTVYIGDNDVLDTFSIPVGEAVRVSYAGENNGPLRVVTSSSSILPSVRVIHKGISYSEMLGLPNSKLTNEYWLPAYDSASVNSQLRIGNVGGQSTIITVYLGDGEVLDSFTLGIGEAVRKNYTGEDGGPLRVVSSASNILVSNRILLVTASYETYYELLAYPDGSLSGELWFPWYNNVAFLSELRIAVP